MTKKMKDWSSLEKNQQDRIGLKRKGVLHILINIIVSVIKKITCTDSHAESKIFIYDELDVHL